METGKVLAKKFLNTGENPQRSLLIERIGSFHIGDIVRQGFLNQADTFFSNEGMCSVSPEEDHVFFLAGEEQWRWVDREKTDRWVTDQPPIRPDSQRVYALTNVLAIEQGNLLWEYEVKDEILRQGSSLADGSILVTAGKTIVHLDRDGKQLLSVSLENEILTPPVVDTEGNIYVATASHLVKIK
ncbi:MAG: outer membrane protein assembly factor BamB family protein [Planctomycetota bacterium]|jgi:hypothetical protein